MIRILHIAQAAGGVERYLYTLLSRLDHTKFENVLVCSQDYDAEKFKDIASDIICVQMQREIGFISELKLAAQLRKIIKKFRPHIVYMHSSKAGAIGRIANVGIHNLSIYNAHGWAFDMKSSRLKNAFYAFLEKIFASLCTKIVAISNYEKELALSRRICRADKIQVIFNGIDFDEAERESHAVQLDFIPPDSFVVGCVGRLSEQKAPEIFIKAARIIKDRISNAYFLMVGDGNQRSDIESLISQYNLRDCVYITGWIGNPLAYIERMNVATLLSRWEGFGLVLPEYMVLNKPIVATKVGAIPDVVSNYSEGLLVDVDDYIAVANAITLIHEDDKLVSIFCRNGQNKVRDRFSATRFAMEHERLFESLTNGRE